MSKSKYFNMVRFSEFKEHAGVLQGHAFLYFTNNPSSPAKNDVHFGRRKAAKLPLDSTSEARVEALEEARNQLLKEFNPIASAKAAGFTITEKEVMGLVSIADGWPNSFATPEEAVGLTKEGGKHV